MSGSSGGRADKLGNRYEGLWVAYNLLRLLAEEVVGVQLEAMGDDEEGVDVWVTRRDGTRDAQQCKRKNRTVGKWGIGELGSQGVLAYLTTQLRRHPTARFTFVSANPAPELRELCDLARSAGGDPDTYFRQTLAVDAHAGHLRKFCQRVGLDASDPAHRGSAFDLLRRTYTHLFEDSPEGQSLVTVLARCLITGEARTAVEVLANFAQDRLGEVLTVEDVRHHLRERGLPPTRIDGHPQAAQQIERLRGEFRESLRPSLIQAHLVPRPEAAVVFDRLMAPEGNRLVVLHGRGGTGKSCVFLQLADMLEQAGIPYLPLRLDRRPPRSSPRQYGVDGCGLPESPAVVLHSVYRGHRTVLILDQLDAVRWTAAHASAPWEVCREVIDDALSLPDVVVVVACRTFDLRDDQQIHAWHALRRGQEVAVGDLPDEAVAGVVDAAGGRYAELTARQRTLLRSPLHLALWAQVVAAGGAAGGWNTHADLLRAFWRSRFDAAAAMGVPAAETRDTVAALVADMDRRGELSAPARVLDPYPRAATALKSLHVLVETGRHVTFAHQTYFEYQLAARLLDQVRSGEGGVVDWVRAGDQTLIRRDQLRLALTLLRDEDPDEYVRTVRGLVLSPAGDVRFHIRQLALRVLGELPNPEAVERDLVRELADHPAWRVHVLDQVFTRHAVWLEAADDAGLLTRWLASSSEELVEAALVVCGWWSARCGDRVAALLAPYLDRPDPWPQRVAGALPFNPSEDSPDLFRIRLLLTRRGVVRQRHLMAEQLADRCPERLIDLLEAHLDREHAHPSDPSTTPADERGFPFLVPRHEAEHLERVADTLPGPVWDRLMPRIVRTSEATRDEDADDRRPPSPFFRDRTWLPEFGPLSYEPSVELPKVVARAGARVATENPVEFGARYADWLRHPGLTVQHVSGLALADAGVGAADLAIGWLCDCPHRLAVPDERGSRWGIAQRIIGRHGRECSPAVYARLEQTILRFHDADERRSFEWQLHCVRSGRPISPNRYGLAQHALLPCLPADRLGETARSEMGVLARKFDRPASEYERHYSARVWTVVGPLPADRAARISNRGWLQIIRGAAGTRSHRHREVDADTVADTSARGFAGLLGERARWEPGRFANFALTIPDDADPAYLAAVLHGIVATSPPNDECTDWRPATDQQLTAIIEHVGYRGDRQIGDHLCWLMRQRSSAVSTNRCLEILCRYATDHPHPAPGWTLSSNDPYHQDAAINCTRGTAVGAIAEMLFTEPCLLGVFAPVLRHAAADHHPAVRVAAVEAALAMLSIDRDLAVELFLSACEGPDEMLAAHRVWQFFRYALWSHYRSLEPLLTRMAGSEVPEVAASGSVWLAVASFHGQCPPSVPQTYALGTPAQRRGVAKAAAHNCDDPQLVGRCADLLGPLLDDPDDGVREQADEFLRRSSVLRTPEGRLLAARFATGRGFVKHASWLIEPLRGHPDSLLPLAPVIEAICGRVAADLRDSGRRAGHQGGFALDRFVPLILRLYEQAEQDRNTRLRTSCLDWWDQLLEARMGGTIQILGDLDATAGIGP